MHNHIRNNNRYTILLTEMFIEVYIYVHFKRTNIIQNSRYLVYHI